jgi:hypothetical protein
VRRIRKCHSQEDTVTDDGEKARVVQRASQGTERLTAEELRVSLLLRWVDRASGQLAQQGIPRIQLGGDWI